jgi:CubicO group peptidase (beta-lactamase class C family)
MPNQAVYKSRVERVKVSLMDGLEAVVQCVRDEGVAPRCAVGFSVRAHAGWLTEVLGDAVFDLASVTKPMTAVAFARSSLDRRTRAAEILPEISGTPSADVPLELFLAHRAGLEAHMALFEPLTRGEKIDRAAAIVTAANSRRADARGASPPEGFAPVYSDMSYMIAGAALARSVGADDCGDATRDLVLAPLAIENVGTARQLEARGVDMSRAAPTEIVSWRGGTITGRVHDENCWALTGAGGSGHAGMFGTVDGVLAFGRAVLDGLDGIGPLASTDMTWLVRERPGGTLRAGFDGKSAEGSSAGTKLGARSFGHLGFTGTSLWIDPDAKVVVSLLTNRVHPTRENIAIRAARPKVHDALFDLAVRARSRS